MGTSNRVDNVVVITEACAGALRFTKEFPGDRDERSGEADCGSPRGSPPPFGTRRRASTSDGMSGACSSSSRRAVGPHAELAKYAVEGNPLIARSAGGEGRFLAERGMKELWKRRVTGNETVVAVTRFTKHP